MDPQSCWNRMMNPSQGQPSDCVVSSSNGSTPYMNSARHEGHASSGWNLCESSSSGACDLINQNNSINDCARAALVLGERRYEFSGNLSFSSLNDNLHTEQIASGSSLMQSTSVPSDLTTNLEFAGTNSDRNNDDDCQVIECGNSFRFGSSSELLSGTSSYSHNFAVIPSENGMYAVEGAGGRPNSSLGGRHLSCKRKMREPSFGQSSGSGSSNYGQNGGSSLCQGTAIYHNAATSMPVAPGNNIGINSEESYPRLGLSIGEAASDCPLFLSTSESAERSRTNFRLRINTSQQQDGEPVTFSCTQSASGTSNVLSAQHSLRVPPITNSFVLGPSNVAGNVSLQRPTVSSLRRNSQSRRTRASISRAANPSSAISGDGVSLQYEEPYLRSVPGVVSQHPMFIPATEIGCSSQNPGNWSLAAKNVGTTGSVASSSHGGSRVGFNSHAPPFVPHHHSPHPSRLPEYAPLSLTTPPGIGSRNQNTSHTPIHFGPNSSLPEIAFPSMSANHGHDRFHTMSSILLERQLGSNVRTPYPSRGLAASSQERSRLVSEIRNVLDRMRRGEALRVEDLMILDQSGFFGMPELHDRHRDMRLDVDNMSYEELLALEERIGNVCTGLSEESISSRLKKRKYAHVTTEVEKEPCCICQDEYDDGEDLGILECGHEFHSGCIKQWLMHKNLCPICKTTGLN
ncbi:ubiquitin-protein ligase [Lithospermum erythrorhizon]|uniref:RING-type E3 ubiquitin transferase n=1 Tax=Lithospermum erythrorhizon TaxID=34254 RepID=A0AAV3P4L4_LITER